MEISRWSGTPIHLSADVCWLKINSFDLVDVLQNRIPPDGFEWTCGENLLSALHTNYLSTLQESTTAKELLAIETRVCDFVKSLGAENMYLLHEFDVSATDGGILIGCAFLASKPIED